jgi:dTDP-4-dehydrorhamnose 3,5-epimerase
MKVIETPLAGLVLLEAEAYEDGRGFFMETFREQTYRDAGIDRPFVQDNLSHSRRHVVRGLHFQRRQGKLVTAVRGEIFDVVVDIRPDSASFGKSFATTLSVLNRRQLYVPPGFAHGFCVLSDQADVWYKATDIYRPDEEGGLAWNDPALGITWPGQVQQPILSSRDQAHPNLDMLERDRLPTCQELGD